MESTVQLGLSPEEFTELVREHEALVFRSLARLSGSREHLEDLAQEVFLRLYRGVEHFRGESKLSTYLYRIIVNVAQDHWRSRQEEREHLRALDQTDLRLIEHTGGNEGNSEFYLDRDRVRKAIERSLEKLTRLEHAALVLYHVEERPYADIARILNIPLGTVRTSLHRGRKALGVLVRKDLGIKEKT